MVEDGTKSDKLRDRQLSKKTITKTEEIQEKNADVYSFHLMNVMIAEQEKSIVDTPWGGSASDK